MIKKLFIKRDKSSMNYESEYLKQAIDTSSIVNFRFLAVGFCIVTCMTLLLIRLYYVQVVNQAYYQEKLTLYTSTSQSVTTPRGEILASDGQVLVGNIQKINVTYFPPSTITDAVEWKLAYQFIEDFSYDISSQSTWDLKDLFLETQTTAFQTWVEDNELAQYAYLITDEMYEVYTNLIDDESWSLYYQGLLSDTDIYYLRLANIPDDILDSLDTLLRQAWACKQAMDLPSSGQSKTIMTDLTMEEAAYFIEHSELYLGFDIDVDWDRYYPYGSLLKGVFGSVSTSTQGLPADNLSYYLALGYSLNEKVGLSGLELQYEDLLSGQRAVYDLSYDDDGIGVFKESETGSKGYDLQTTIDVDLQLYIENLLLETLTAYEEDERREYMTKIQFVAQDPTTGDVLAMANVTRSSDGSYYTDPTSTYTMAYEPGSIVKGATVYMGLDSGVISENEYIYDQPIKLSGTELKSSWENMGSVNELQALARSSNVYMFYIAMRMAGTVYTYDGSLYVQSGTFDLMRNYYSLFGLGILTGIDLPNESIGYTGISQTGGLILDYAIGQYDTYTTLQLSQYIATIANDGVKLRPRIVTAAYEPGTKIKVYENEVEVLNVADNYEAIQRVQQGFWDCVNTTYGICYGYGDLKTQIAAKTGTAEATVVVDGESIDAPHNSVVAYAPYDEPTISVACLIPNAWNGGETQSNLCLSITNQVLEAYLTGNY